MSVLATNQKLAAVFVWVACFAACNYTDGECYRRDPGTENGGVGGGVITTTGVGAYGDVPREPQDATDPAGVPACNADEEAPAGAEVRCLVPGSDACVEQCAAAEAYCVHRAAHPYSPSSGLGAGEK